MKNNDCDIKKYYCYYYNILLWKNLSKNNFPYDLRAWPFRMASAVMPKPIENQLRVRPARMTIAYEFPYDPRMAIYLKKISDFSVWPYVWPFRMASAMMPKPIENQLRVWPPRIPPRMSSTYDFCVWLRVWLRVWHLDFFLKVKHCSNAMLYATKCYYQ